MILLDTNALLWLANDAPQLGEQARNMVRAAPAPGEIAISAICFWEMGLLIEKSRIVLPMPLGDFASYITNRMGIRVVPVNSKIAIESGQLPPRLHGDPGDRLIAATARVMASPLLTSDRKLLAYGAAGHLNVIDARL